MANTNLIEELVISYEELGFGVITDPNTLVGVDGEGEISFDPLVDGDGDTVGVIIFSNGDQVDELHYDDENFNKKLLDNVTGALNL